MKSKKSIIVPVRDKSKKKPKSGIKSAAKKVVRKRG